MRGGVRGATHAYTLPCETLVVASSRSIFEALAAREVLAHPRAMFHPCICGLHRAAVVVAAALIGYDHKKVAGTTTSRRRS
jgi:hypothetical protein